MIRACTALLLLVLSATLAACGGGSSTAKTNAAAIPGAAQNSRQAAIDCLRKHGVKPGQGGAATPRAFQAARQACAQFFRAGAFPRATPAQRAKRRAAYAAVQACMAKNGYKLPARPAGGGPGGPGGPTGGFGRGGGFRSGAALQAALSSPAGRKAVLACRTQIAALRGPGGVLNGGAGLRNGDPGAPGAPPAGGAQGAAGSATGAVAQ